MCLLVGAHELTTGTPVTAHEELACFQHALRTTKYDFVLGHLAYVVSTYPIDIARYIHDQHSIGTSVVRTQPPAVDLIVRPPSVTMLRSLLEHGFVVCYLDAFVLYHSYHYPHFVIIRNYRAGMWTVIDPWDGRKKRLTSWTLSQGIHLLRKHIGLCPQVLVLKRRESGAQ